MSASLLPLASVFVTGTDAKGDSILLSESKPEMFVMKDAKGRDFYRIVNPWATNSLPTNNQDDKNYGPEQAGFYQENGAVLRIIDFAPGCYCCLHRTKCLDYGVILNGEITVMLDNGKEFVMKAGDAIAKRGTMHGWINKSKDWVRMIFVVVDSAPIKIDGRVLEDDFSGLGEDEPWPV